MESCKRESPSGCGSGGRSKKKRRTSPIPRRLSEEEVQKLGQVRVGMRRERVAKQRCDAASALRANALTAPCNTFCISTRNF